MDWITKLYIRAEDYVMSVVRLHKDIKRQERELTGKIRENLDKFYKERGNNE